MQENYTPHEIEGLAQAAWQASGVFETDENSDKEKFWYYLDADSKQEGPMSYDGLLRNYSEGLISQETHVWNENFDAW